MTSEPKATTESAHPLLYQLNTRVRLTELGRGLGRPATLDDLPDAELDWLATAGFEWLYLLGVWQTGPAGREVSRTHTHWRAEFAATLADLTEDDMCGSPFAVTGYTVHADFGGDAALARLREGARQRGLRVMLDFVPNHTAIDHPWAATCPDRYVSGTEADLAHQPRNFVRVDTVHGPRVLAHGRDPYFDGWPDTLQLDYSHPEVVALRIDELRAVARRCDGLRCDMAMLVVPDVFERTWGLRAGDFWPEAIAAVRAEHPGFTFLAEVYWGLEPELVRLGFDLTYDKGLYDRLRGGDARAVRAHLEHDPAGQAHRAHFLENHDEGRAAATFPPDQHRAAAVVTYTTPGLRFFHQGQLVGRRVRISPHLGRGPDEPVDDEIRRFYQDLLGCCGDGTLRNGTWSLLATTSAWDTNPTHDDVLAWSWAGPDGARVLVAVNYAAHQSQCYVRLPFADLGGRAVVLTDRLSTDCYVRDGTDLGQRGLYLDVEPWKAHVFDVTAASD